MEEESGCLQAGEGCVRHCVDLMGKGDTSLHRCLQSVLPMKAVCGALEKLASYADTPETHLRAYAAVSAG